MFTTISHYLPFFTTMLKSLTEMASGAHQGAAAKHLKFADM
jgi:hypothetical protein